MAGVWQNQKREDANKSSPPTLSKGLASVSALAFLFNTRSSSKSLRLPSKLLRWPCLATLNLWGHSKQKKQGFWNVRTKDFRLKTIGALWLFCLSVVTLWISQSQSPSQCSPSSTSPVSPITLENLPTKSLKPSQQAASELLKRRAIRKSLPDWVAVNGFVPARHHQLINAELSKVASGETKRLALFLPPGSAKSTYASVLFPPWYLGKNPDHCIIAASHTAELAERFGRRVRNLVGEHGNTLGVNLAADSTAAGRWNTDKGGEYYAAGIGGSITGRRADLAIIDDPIRSREDAESKLIRDRQWEWFKFDLMTRLKPEGAIILIQTRWHEDDLAGRILAEEGDKWRVVSLPMLAEEDDALGRKAGEQLWPGYFTPQQIADARRDPRVWSSLYQQNPTPEDGGVFRREWLMPYSMKDLPTSLHIYIASDHAVSTKEHADKTCVIPAGVDRDGTIWILPDVFWERCAPDDFVNASIEMAQRRKPLIWAAEKGHISKSIGPFWRKALIEAGVALRIEEITPSGDKVMRAQNIIGRMAMGRVRFPTFAPWWADAESELLSFPAGKHDDFVDALAHLGGIVDKMTPCYQDQRSEFERQVRELAENEQQHDIPGGFFG